MENSHLEQNDESILNEIQLKGSMGVNKTMLKKLVNLPQNVVNFCVKKLIKEGLIREFKTKKRNQVVYLARGFLPD